MNKTLAIRSDFDFLQALGFRLFVLVASRSSRPDTGRGPRVDGTPSNVDPHGKTTGPRVTCRRWPMGKTLKTAGHLQKSEKAGQGDGLWNVIQTHLLSNLGSI